MNNIVDSGFKMALFLLLLMLTACAAIPQDLSGKMFVFPQATNTANVRLTTSRQNLNAVTLCLRLFTDLGRDYSAFSLATSGIFNDFLVFGKPATDEFHLYVRNSFASFRQMGYKLNTWQSMCFTWDSISGEGQIWLDGRPSSRKFINSGSSINGPIIIVLGQEQDSYGGGFDVAQSFVGMMTDVHLWDYALSPCQIQRYSYDFNSIEGNVLTWKALSFQMIGRVRIDDKQKSCTGNLIT